ncbi:hypothetical protein [Hominibacterium faecale]|uniref:Uncharacterized protein n=1 Tax=Hominibacterium faecale TaxID=2839743 RepID=A0A9J6QZT0_9FIRM|nr:hypothetical protein [Hominibacterium faecale]MCU7380964.1 hypothetical protein [Hominibacterium faecale]
MKKQNLVGAELTFKELDDLMVRQGYESELQYVSDLSRVIEKKYIGYTFDMGLTIDVLKFKIISENEKDPENTIIRIMGSERLNC